MKRHYFLLLGIVLSGCKLPTGPEYQPPERSSRNLPYTGLITSPIPNAPYDGIFISTEHVDEFINSAGVDSMTITYISRPTLFNRLGDELAQLPWQDSVAVDGVLFSHSIGLDLKFPSSVNWSMKGDSYFPAFSHTLNSEELPNITSPPLSDSLDADSLIHLNYAAPGADTLSIYSDYLGKAHWKGDHPDSLSFAAESHFDVTPNTGIVTLLPFILDTSYYTSFTPTLLSIDLAWGKGDTIHVGDKIFGFVTIVDLSRSYSLK